MTDAPRAQFAFITTPETNKPVINLQEQGAEIIRFELNYEQMLRLNHQIVDVLVGGQVR